MSGIEVSIRRLNLPDWVNKAYESLPLEDKEVLVKELIYSQIQPIAEGFKISQFLRDGANRVEVLDDIGECLWALCCAVTVSAWHAMNERKETPKEPMIEPAEKEG